MLYLKETYGMEKFNNALLKPLEQYKEFAGTDKDIPLAEIDMPANETKGKILYIKGPYIFYKLHEKMGTELYKADSRGSFSGYFRDLIHHTGMPDE
jgi:hypothetical protein